MKIRIFLLVITMAIIVAFVALNWSTIMIKTTLSLGVTAIHAPLGFVILGLLTMFTLLFIVVVIYSKASGFLRGRHQTQEMKVRQEISDNDESLYFTELREQLGAKLKRQTDPYSGLTATMLVKLEQLDGVLRSVTKELGHTFSAPEESIQFKKNEEK
jgi:uncharacterized membrane protein